MNAGDKGKTFVADNGTEYTLSFNGLFYWTRSGTTVAELKGSFLSLREAKAQFARYNASLKPSVTNPVGELNSLEKKAELLGYVDLAEKRARRGQRDRNRREIRQIPLKKRTTLFDERHKRGFALRRPLMLPGEQFFQVLHRIVRQRHPRNASLARHRPHRPPRRSKDREPFVIGFGFRHENLGIQL